MMQFLKRLTPYLSGFVPAYRAEAQLPVVSPRNGLAFPAAGDAPPVLQAAVNRRRYVVRAVRVRVHERDLPLKGKIDKVAYESSGGGNAAITE